jgi:glucans biosynthesis protein
MTSRSTTAPRALGRLARTFPAQIEALNRHRSQGQPAISVHNVSIGDGGKAIVGNVTQHANVIVFDKSPPRAARHAENAARAGRAAPSRRCRVRCAAMSDHSHHPAPMLASPRCGAQTRCGRPCRAPAVRGKARCRMHSGAAGSGAPSANRNARKHGFFSRDAIAERRRIRAALEEARKFLKGME